MDSNEVIAQRFDVIADLEQMIKLMSEQIEQLAISVNILEYLLDERRLQKPYHKHSRLRCRCDICNCKDNYAVICNHIIDYHYPEQTD